jgi:hypothetical protein
MVLVSLVMLVSSVVSMVLVSSVMLVSSLVSFVVSVVESTVESVVFVSSSAVLVVSAGSFSETPSNGAGAPSPC